ncbi:MAG TPA: hypothetical protein VG841_11730 [Caulobacterales bacterium]|nr:hypothetical protein [Caulobacterales bacterium]
MPEARAAKPSRPARGDFNLADMLGQAGWAEADRALARALMELHALEQAVDAAKAPRQSEPDANADALEACAVMLRQSLLQVARKRGLSPLGAAGAREPFDHRRHELMKPGARSPAMVKIAAPGWMRGDDILAKALAVPARSRSARK